MSSQQYDNNRKGALFLNDERRAGKRDADYRGSCEIDGVQYWINCWNNQSKGGRDYMSLTFVPKQAQDHQGGTRNPPARQIAPNQGRTAGSRQETAAPAAAHDSFDDDDKIPF